MKISECKGKIKVGDRLKILNSEINYKWEVEIYSVSGDWFLATGKCIRDNGRVSEADIKNPFAFNFLSNGEYEIEILTNNTMNIKEKFVQAFLKEPEKSFRKAEITNGDGILTDDGQKIFMSWLLKKHGDEFKTEVVDELLKDEEK